MEAGQIQKEIVNLDGQIKLLPLTREVVHIKLLPLTHEVVHIKLTLTIGSA